MFVNINVVQDRECKVKLLISTVNCKTNLRIKDQDSEWEVRLRIRTVSVWTMTGKRRDEVSNMIVRRG